MKIKELCRKRYLNEKYLDENSNDLDWDAVSKFQNISVDFIKRHKQKINFSLLSDNRFVNPNIITAFANEPGFDENIALHRILMNYLRS